MNHNFSTRTSVPELRGGWYCYYYTPANRGSAVMDNAEAPATPGAQRAPGSEMPEKR